MSIPLHTTAFEVDGRAARLRWVREKEEEEDSELEERTGWVLLRDLRNALGVSTRGRAQRSLAVHCKTSSELGGVNGLPPAATLVNSKGVSLVLSQAGLGPAAKLACGEVLKDIFGDHDARRADAQRPSVDEPTPSAEQCTTLCVAPAPPDREARIGRLQELTAAYQSAELIKSSSTNDLRRKLQECIDEVALPPGEQCLADYVDAAGILQERAYAQEHIARLAGELGKDLKLAKSREEEAAQSAEQRFGAESQKRVGLYHRTTDAQLIEDVLAAFRRRNLHQRVISGSEDPVARRKREARYSLLETEGRGRPGGLHRSAARAPTIRRALHVK